MRIYLDSCVYNRPFDDQQQPRINLETQAFLLILHMAEKKGVILINSFALKKENNNNPYVDRREMIADILLTAPDYIKYDKHIGKRAKELEEIGIMSMDALHIACAEKANADIFVTCDDILVKKCEGSKKNMKVKIISLLRFITEEVFKI